MTTAFQDTQNHLLNIIQDVGNGNFPTQKLSDLTNWNSEQITFLVDKLKLTLPVTIADISLLKKYFDTANLLGIDIKNLWSLVQLSTLKGENPSIAEFGGNPLGQALKQAAHNLTWTSHNQTGMI